MTIFLLLCSRTAVLARGMNVVEQDDSSWHAGILYRLPSRTCLHIFIKLDQAFSDTEGVLTSPSRLGSDMSYELSTC